MIDKEKLERLAKEMKDVELARYFKVSRQRIHQIRKGYESPYNIARRKKPTPIEENTNTSL